MAIEIEPKTKTFAEIYESQGYYKEAIYIYIELLKENPLDNSLINSIKRLQSLISEENAAKKRAAELQISALGNFLQKVYAYRVSRLN
ncbi:MAG: hypothetical protein M1458_00320 [Deltaproteobacteria bacterium]|nr:hypothetical protein [Deltaproteobacteria bacterium]